MVNGQKRKKELKRVARERAKMNNRNCIICNKILTKTMHHKYCGMHWSEIHTVSYRDMMLGEKV